jgi:hypothetical protein
MGQIILIWAKRSGTDLISKLDISLKTKGEWQRSACWPKEQIHKLPASLLTDGPAAKASTESHKFRFAKLTRAAS